MISSSISSSNSKGFISSTICLSKISFLELTSPSIFHHVGGVYIKDKGPSPIKDRFIKMKGRKVYEFALNNVPNAMKESLELANVEIENLKKIFT